MNVKDLKEFLEPLDDDMPLYKMGHTFEFEIEAIEDVIGVACDWVQRINGKKTTLPARLTFMYD